MATHSVVLRSPRSERNIVNLRLHCVVDRLTLNERADLHNETYIYHTHFLNANCIVRCSSNLLSIDKY